MRVVGSLVALAVGALALTSCGTATSASGPASGPASASVPASSTSATTAPRGLVGLWNVTKAGEPAGTVLRLSADELSLLRPCGVLSGGWAADIDGTLLTDITTGPKACRTGTELTPGWLVPPSGVKPDGSGGWLIHDREGTVVAQLTRARRVSVPPGLDQSLATPPQLDAAAERRMAPAAPLPAGLEAATGRSIAGSWGAAKATSASARAAVLNLQESGAWTGSDGCNTSSGRWVTGTEGRVLVTSGASTKVGCDNVPLPQWWQLSARAGLDGEQLVLLDTDGKELARLVHVPSRAGASHGPKLTR